MEAIMNKALTNKTMMDKRGVSRREFLKFAALATAGATLAACVAPAAPGAGGEGGGSSGPAVTKASVATNDFEARFEEVGRQWEGVTLRSVVGGHGHWLINEEAAKRFTELTGIETVWENNPYEQVYDKTFLDLGSQSGTYDILDLNWAWFGQFIATDGLLKLQPYVDNAAFPPVDLSKFVPPVLETYAKWEGELYGLPWLGDAMVFPYNQKHFEEVGLDPAAPPTTWNEVHEFGKQLITGDRYGFALMGGRQIQAMCTYAAIFFGLANKDFYNEAGEPQFDSPEGHEAMEIIALQLTEIAPPAAVTWDIEQAAASVAQGVCSMEIQWPGILPSIIDASSSKVIGEMAFVTPPLGTPLGGHAIGVSNYSQNKDAAYLLSEYLVSPEIQRQYVSEGYAITLTELFEDPEVQETTPWIKSMGEAMAIGHGWPRTEESNEVFDIMVKHINAAITKEEAPDAAVTQMNQEIYDLRQERGFIS
jgi:multiple sugar transport system substrate-binding protein